MTRLRSTGYLVRRIVQTPRLFRNFPEVFATLLRPGAEEITFRMRNGLEVSCPNVAGARFPLYEIFGDDAYRLDEVLAAVDDDAVVLDIGGQIGSFSLAVAQRLRGARVHVYEASPASARFIQGNVDRNGLGGRVTVHPVALSDKEGQFTFVDSGHASGHNGLTAPDGLGVEVTVPANTFDHAVRAAGGEVQVVKIDIEGAEYPVLFASSPESWRSVRSVVMEYHPSPEYTLADLLDFFHGLGLSPSRIEPVSDVLGSAWLTRR